MKGAHKNMEQCRYKAVAYGDDDPCVAEDEAGYDDLDEAIGFCRKRGWDEVVDAGTGKAVWSRRSEKQ